MSAKSTLGIRAHPRPIFPLTLLQIVYTRTMKNTWKFLGPTLAATAAAVGAGYYWLFRRPLPQTNGTISLHGLDRPVTIAEVIPALTAKLPALFASETSWLVQPSLST